MSQTCTACNGELAPGAKFCRHCGARVEAAVAATRAEPAAPPPPPPGTCPACQTGNPPSARFCRGCGGPLPEPAAAPTPAPAPAPVPPPEPVWEEPAPAKRPVLLYVLGGLVALAALGAGAWFGNNLIAKGSPDATATGPAAPATAAVTGPFESIKLERFIEENAVYSAVIAAKAGPLEILAEGRRYCLANAQNGCMIVLVPNGKTFPSAAFLELNPGSAEGFLNDLSRNGGMVGVFGRRTATDPGELELNCDLMTAPGNEPAVRCHGAAEAAAAAAASEAAADASAAAAAGAAADASGGTYYLVADANLRSRSTADSENKGKISRGTMLTGSMIIGEDGKSTWLMLANGNGYVSAVNLSANAPPQLSTIFGARAFKPEEDLALYAAPDTGSALVDTIPAGTAIVITGITGNGFVEAKGRRGGVGYFPSAGHNLGTKR